MSIRHQLNIAIRVAVVQLECHQAAVIGARDYSGEPYVDAIETPIDHLLNLGVTDLLATRDEIRNRYFQWHKARVMSTLHYLSELPRSSTLWKKKKNPRPIFLIVFPEYSLPLELLPDVWKWTDEFCKELNASNFKNSLIPVVFAGTHTLPEKTPHTMKLYKSIRAKAEDIESCYTTKLPTKSVLPVFYFDSRRKRLRTRLIPKRILSPFELTNMGRHTSALNGIENRSVRVPVVLGDDAKSKSAQSVSFLPLICSEALQLSTFSVKSDCDVAVIPAYNTSANHFESVTKQLTQNQHLVILCNDGKYGGSGFQIAPSHRGDSWWLTGNQGKLGPGDALIVADVLATELAEKRNVSNPSERCQLQRLSSIVPNNETDGSFLAAKGLSWLRKNEVESGRTFSVDLETRMSILRECLELHAPSNLQERKIRRLMNLQRIDKNQWDLHANDALFPHDEQNSQLAFGILQLETQLIGLLAGQSHQLRDWLSTFNRYCWSHPARRRLPFAPTLIV